jgi:hypothetical protein
VLLFSTVKVLPSFWQKVFCATFWAIFFTNSSGHPADASHSVESVFNSTISSREIKRAMQLGSCCQ